MFIDEARIEVRAGDGGDGRVSFRREKFVPRGGPDGGDGGDGGSVVLVVDPNANTLAMFRHKKQFWAKHGDRGEGSRKTGASGADLEITVPMGTIVRDADTSAVLADMSESDDRVTVARGGRGGRGNTHFATPTNQTPRRADPGGTGEERVLELELKVLADVGLVGFPNAGKSTLLSRVSAARPKIAGYPFTTLQPNLGIVSYGEYGGFVMADIPGIIEGAHEGKGLGLQFLRHIERTKVLLFMVDCTDEDPAKRYRLLDEELAAYSPALVEKPRIAALTKHDLLPPDEPCDSNALGTDVLVHVISAVSGEGIDRLVHALGGMVGEAIRSRIEG